MISSSPGLTGATNTPTGDFARTLAADAPPRGFGPLVIWRLDTVVDDVAETRLAALRDGSFVGTLAVRHRGREAAGVRQVFVHEECRGQGIGTALMQEACAIATASGCSTLTATLLAANRETFDFYRKLGFFFALEYDDGDAVLAKLLKGGG